MSKIRLLIIARENESTEALKSAIISHPDYETEIYNSFAEAREALGYRVHEVVLVDLHAPGVSLRDLIRHMRHAHPLCAVLAFSAKPSLSEIHECMEFGYADYFTAPPQKDEVLDAINYHVKKYRRWNNSFRVQ